MCVVFSQPFIWAMARNSLIQCIPPWWNRTEQKKWNVKFHPWIACHGNDIQVVSLTRAAITFLFWELIGIHMCLEIGASSSVISQKWTVNFRFGIRAKEVRIICAGNQSNRLCFVPFCLSQRMRLNAVLACHYQNCVSRSHFQSYIKTWVEVIFRAKFNPTDDGKRWKWW